MQDFNDSSDSEMDDAIGEMVSVVYCLTLDI